jgi:hypothetical protein
MHEKSLLIHAGFCERCELIAPLEDFIIDALGYVTSRALAGRVHIGLRCPRCDGELISEGESAAPTPGERKLAKLRYAIQALDVSDALKDRALAALDAGDDWGRELLELINKAA